MKEYTSWSNNEENNGVNTLTGREEIEFPKDEQEMIAKEYLHLAQKAENYNQISLSLIKKIDNLNDELHVEPEMNGKLLELNRNELSINMEKEKNTRTQMEPLFEKMDNDTKNKYLTKKI